VSVDLTPRELVSELDKFIVGQAAAKRAVAIAVRNRWRRKRVPPQLRDEVAPKNIIMIGPTGVGKTEIARRLATLVRSPFIKVEASKFTEVGYVGRDVEGMVRDLADAAVSMVKAELRRAAEAECGQAVEDRLLDLLLPDVAEGPAGTASPSLGPALDEERERRKRSRERFRQMLREGKLDDREVEVSYERQGGGESLMPGAPGAPGMDLSTFDLRGLMEKLGSRRRVTRKVKVPEARALLLAEEAEKRVDADKARDEGLARAQSDGIIFLDELDKIAVPSGSDGRSGGPDVSRSGVQRDLLPIVEGTTVQTRHGLMKTDHVLFIAAGAFHVAKPSDLMPELQGRFPIRVELASLGRDEFRRILTEPEAALTKQYSALLATEGVTVLWADDGVEALADLARDVNERTQNIGARRLHTLVEKLLEDLLFEAPDRRGVTVTVTRDYVLARLQGLVQDEDLARFIL
jgi:ATP-dependent HslUV protease ATP-binding subunit HslU